MIKSDRYLIAKLKRRSGLLVIIICILIYWIIQIYKDLNYLEDENEILYFENQSLTLETEKLNHELDSKTKQIQEIKEKDDNLINKRKSSNKKTEDKKDEQKVEVEIQLTDSLNQN